ncbi:MAG: ParB/RepB/Spo0J family partition protein, partial [Planctomycetaceae bacterium]|nr:ParB/RepB/Spo0J family partition protein [Planctomycetaceae bacterium]
LRTVAVSLITRNPFQPRKDFDPQSLGDLAASIKEHGVLQPLLVREVDGGYQLIAGERRWKAAQKAGLQSIPCQVVDVIDKTACEYALEENLKRQDLNDLEKAQAFRDYISHFECSIEELAKQLSMSRSAISNLMRLLELSDPVKNALHSGKISGGHARALLPLEPVDQLQLVGRIQAEGLSVRKTESAVRELLGRPEPAAVVSEPVPAPQNFETAPVNFEPAPQFEAAPVPAMSEPEFSSEPVPALSIEAAREESEELRTNHILSLEQQLTDLFGVKVQIKLKSKECGSVIIPFDSNMEFERILNTARRAG